HPSKAISSRYDGAVMSANDSLKLHIAILTSANQPIAQPDTAQWGDFCVWSSEPYTKPDALPLEQHRRASREVRHKHKDGPGYILGELTGDMLRTKENIVSLSALVLDFDDGTMSMDEALERLKA